MMHNFSINDFEGPLDLLLHLIRVNEMDIYDINIESITRQYIDFINASQNLSVDDTSEYLVMAAELIHLKSKSLIKQDDSENTDDSEYEFNSTEELRDKLLEYETIKEITSSFKELEEKRSEFFTKLPSDLTEYRTEEKLVGDEASLNDLIDAFKLFLERQKLERPLNTKITKKEYSVSDRTNEIRNILKKEKKCNFTHLFDTFTKPYIVVTFLSILEMSKNNELIITQDKNFGDIYLEMK